MLIRKGKYSKILIPLSRLYAIGVWVRNALFDNKIIKSKTYDIPIICVGNISVGGTGKTPHVEYILSIISKEKKVAVVSRGYKRKTKGLVVANKKSTAREIGDEPYQIKKKFPNVKVVVDGNRRRAIEYLLSLDQTKRPDVIVMDDGFQHRYVKPSFSIILQSYDSPFNKSEMLPYGDMREDVKAIYRADCIIVTKCPTEIKPMEYRIVERDLNLFPHQYMFFSRIKYCEPKQMDCFFDQNKESPTIPDHSKIILLAGIANPDPMIEYLDIKYKLECELIFEDHKYFNKKSISYIEDAYWDYKKENQDLYIITTEKDLVRINEVKEMLDEEIQKFIYYLPIETEIVFDKYKFDKLIKFKSSRQSLKNI